MKRSEALALVGHPVRAWTAANGVYAGVLCSIHGSPWRGIVRITGVLEVAQHLERGRACRRGFRPGEEIEVGGSSIRALQPGEPSSVSYLEALQAYASVWAQRVVHGPNAWLPPVMVDVLSKAIAAERRQLAGGEWRIGP